MAGRVNYNFRIDARKTSLSDALLKADSPIFGSRAYFKVPKVGQTALVVENIQEIEEDVYVCRVDFEEAPTEYSKVNLTIIG